jgi:DNA invertase Pin-like site-specific DNA recombinase
MQNYFAYVRVSTAKQGEKGVSLQEQRDAIESYACRSNLAISRWFEDRETAAKSGRPVFAEMLKLLRERKGVGVIIHKIDRSARNLKDWANLGELIDAGSKVHFVNESLDLHSRGGRLSADIQAVVAADYIRNLREETRKGFYGRLKQGLYPLPAPIGYLDQGKGAAKIPDPSRAPVVIQAFRLYATGEYSLPRLLEEIRRRGLRTRTGGNVSLNGLSRMLNNPFYAGLIRLTSTGELFGGAHEALISQALFNRVQEILKGKTVNRTALHDFVFRRMIRCAGCPYSLIGELQKGRVYYRCHTRTCSTKSVREDRLDDTLAETFDRLVLDEEELDYARDWVRGAHVRQEALRIEEIENLKFQLNQVRAHLERLTDALLDGTIERDVFERRKNVVLLQENDLKGRLATLEAGNPEAGLAHLEKFLELVNTASFLYKHGLPEEKRDLLKRVTSNLVAGEKNVVVALKNEVQLLAERPKLPYCSPRKGAHRTWGRILEHLLKYFTHEIVTAN